MLCPYCSAQDSKVLETRRSPVGTLRRRRKCKGCARTYLSEERVHSDDLMVRKVDGRIEPFDRMKIIRGINKAACVQPIPVAEVDAFVDRIIEAIRKESGDDYIATGRIGELVLENLHDTSSATDVARIRFSMVLNGRATHAGGVTSIAAFVRWLELNYPQAKNESLLNRPKRVLKRGTREPQDFVIQKLERSIGIAAKGRGTDAMVHALAYEVADQAVSNLGSQPIVTSQQIACEVMRVLRDKEPLAYLRYASAVKMFRSAEDFWHEAQALIQR